MSEPTTEPTTDAGKALNVLLVNQGIYADTAIAAIEAEAVSIGYQKGYASAIADRQGEADDCAEAVKRYKAALRAEVEAMARGVNPSRSRLLDPGDVLAAIDRVTG